MKNILLLVGLLAALCANAQSVSIRVVANDGTVNSTNVISAPAHVVQGLLITWAEETASRTNKGQAKLVFADYVAQEINVKSKAEWAVRGAIKAIEAAGATNTPPRRLVEIWPTLNATQKSNAVNFVNQLGQ